MKKIITKTIRRLLSDKQDNYIFCKVEENSQDICFPENGGLYIHVPFCKNMCPYCPYYKEQFNELAARRYKLALLKEIEKYGSMLKDSRFTSLYFGGGTPTLIIDDLFDIVRHIRKNFKFEGYIGLETTPKDLTHENLVKLKRLGVNLLSIGVQSFQDKFLACIGRNYYFDDVKENLMAINEYEFETVNYDMIFIFPNQKKEDLKKDLDTALSFKPNQITYYPLFTFPYTSIGKFKKLKSLKLPNVFKRRSMYYFIHRYLEQKGFNRSSVWSFNREGTVPYSSVTRDFYIGLGPGAGSYTKDGFYFNTFSVESYVRMLEKDKLPLALKMDVSNRMSKMFWLYWRLYETKIPKEEYEELFNTCVDKDFSRIMKIIKLLGFVEKDDESGLRLNEKGTHWIHLVQNYFALNYVTEIWSAFKKNPFPERVVI